MVFWSCRGVQSVFTTKDQNDWGSIPEKVLLRLDLEPKGSYRLPVREEMTLRAGMRQGRVLHSCTLTLLSVGVGVECFG